jgi:hypothetical protein
MARTETPTVLVVDDKGGIFMEAGGGALTNAKGSELWDAVVTAVHARGKATPAGRYHLRGGALVEIPGILAPLSE